MDGAEAGAPSKNSTFVAQGNSSPTSAHESVGSFSSSSMLPSSFRSEAESDDIEDRILPSDAAWEQLLPLDYDEIISRSVEPVRYASKKELYFRLCDSILIDGGKKSFTLDKSTGKKCYLLSARDLLITWGGTPHYWEWISLPDSRFSEVAKLLDVCWLEIHGKIDTGELSKKTTYTAYLIHKLADPRGFSGETQKTSVVVGSHVSRCVVSLEPGSLLQQNSNVYEGLISFPCERNDGWMEIEMGEFYNDEGNDGEVYMILKEVEVLMWKGGLIIEGIEVRPKKVY